jgi:hypothetical protein
MNKDIAHYAGVYRRYKDQYSQLSVEVVEELHEYVNSQYQLIPCIVNFVPQLLDDYEVVKRGYTEKGVLNISTLNSNSRLFPGDLNLRFRAIHDYVHLRNNLDFSYEGEWQTWLIQSRHLSTEARGVLFSEIVLQASYALYYGSFPEYQKIILI